jgi:hypothetical protein
MSLLNRSKHYLPMQIRILLYKSLVVCHLDYCNILWGNATASLLKPLKSSKKKALRVALCAPYNSHSEPLFNKINALRLEDMVHFSLAKLGSKIIESRSPLGVTEAFQTLESSSTLRSRKFTTFIVPTCRINANPHLPSYIVNDRQSCRPNIRQNNGLPTIRQPNIR